MPQSLACVFVHVVFSTKNREPVIREEDRPDVHAFLGGIARDCSCPALIVGGTADHVHLLVSLSRTASLAALVEELKTRSSKWLKTKGPCYTGFHWQTGYGAFSIGRSNEGATRRYIENQKAHHGSRSFQDEFRQLLKAYQVEFDERYVWD